MNTVNSTELTKSQNSLFKKIGILHPDGSANKDKLLAYGNALKRIDNCSPQQIQSISKSLSKLQMLRHRQNTCNEME